jgi:hypothetical protein
LPSLGYWCKKSSKGGATLVQQVLGPDELWKNYSSETIPSESLFSVIPNPRKMIIVPFKPMITPL